MDSTLGKRIRDRRLELGISLAFLAQAVGCAKSYLSLIETGKKSPPKEDLLVSIERALMLPGGCLVGLARLQRTPESIRRQLHSHEATRRHLSELLRSGGLERAYHDGTLRKLIEESSGPEPVALAFEVPVINSVAAGYPCEFTDLGYPARIADDYVRCPDLHDPDAFGARVVGDSMNPNYVEGDIVIFSPARDATEGSDCFCRLERDNETTFKRVYYERGEDDEELIRLQPLNMAYSPRVLEREEVAGLYPAVSVLRMVG